MGEPEFKIEIKTGPDGTPRIEVAEGVLPPNATMTITGSENEDADPWVQFIVINDVVINTGAVTGRRRHYHTELTGAH